MDKGDSSIQSIQACIYWMLGNFENLVNTQISWSMANFQINCQSVPPRKQPECFAFAKEILVLVKQQVII